MPDAAHPAPTTGAASAPLDERRLLAELANCFGAAARAYLAFRGFEPHEAAALAETFFAELGADRITLESRAQRLRELVLAALRTSLTGANVRAPEPDSPAAARHFHERWARALAGGALGAFRGELERSHETDALAVIGPLLAGPVRESHAPMLAIALQLEPASALARVHLLRHRFGETVRSLAAGTVCATTEIDSELQEISRLAATPRAGDDAAIPHCRACAGLLLPDAPLPLCVSCLLRTGTGASLTAEAVAAAEADAPAAGSRFAQYEILEEIGRGGMGVIHRARQAGTDRIVAVKLMQPAFATSPEIRERFRRESRAAASLDHPGVLPVFEVGEKGALPFFSMKYAEGGNLADALPRFIGRPRRAAELMARVARAVHHAHERGLLHRDLKPANILLDLEGLPYVTDFGLARWIDDPGDLTRSLVVLGTAGYVAPEQAGGSSNAISPRADVYSLGVLLFEVLTGERPFPGDNALAILRRAAVEPAPLLRSRHPELPRELEQICDRALQGDAAMRYSSAGELAYDLERWLAGDAPRHHRLPLRRRLRQWMQRHPAARPTVLGALGLLAVGAATVVATRESRDPYQGTKSKEAIYFVKRAVNLAAARRDAASLKGAVEMIERALALDPAYAMGYAELSRLHTTAYARRWDHSEARARLALGAAEEAVRLKPTLARAQLAFGEYHYRCRREDAEALERLRRARDLDPRDVDIHGLLAVVAKRRHEWDEAIASAREITRLEGNKPACWYDLAVTYEVVRRYDDALAAFDRAAFLAPESTQYIANRGWILFRAKGDLSGLADFTRRVPAARHFDDEILSTVLPYRLLHRDFDEALRLVHGLAPDFVLEDSTTYWPRSFLLALVLSARGEPASEALREAAALLEAASVTRPTDARVHGALARVYAMQDRPDDAAREARLGMKLDPIETEPVDGPDRVVDLAEVQLRAGQIEEGCTTIRGLLAIPGYLTVHDLRLDPRWDFARGFPAFTALSAAAVR